ncbi:DUF58 domain-containing protein [Oryzibacter oryziterrae]|uniref:DUF58 domain-containing protein n=1 Tax=Oryzibacter oryziterrae TaxID=2766474 RepID=UPI001F1C70E3|nr:DUF58 domain-containing protein [Oryzibacter oryziterrae]
MDETAPALIGSFGPQDLAGARTLAAALPDLMVDARQVASTVTAGWHGRRRPGVGEDFWQFRPFLSGEAMRMVDWRRSARDDTTLYVRERELENAHTVWLWTDLSPSMQFRSAYSGETKRDRGLLLMFALCELLARAGERVGLIGERLPVASRHAVERLAQRLVTLPQDAARPAGDSIRRWHDVVIFSDFLAPIAELEADLDRLRAIGARVHLIQVFDPVEETFPFEGRTEFRAPEFRERLTAGRAEAWRQDYLDRLAAHRTELREVARAPGWSFIVHRTDRSAAELLLSLHGRLSAAPAALAGGDQPDREGDRP